MCQLALGFEAREQRFEIPHGSADALRAFEIEVTKSKKWPTRPLVIDLWADEPPLIVQTQRLIYLTTERCEEAQSQKQRGLPHRSTSAGAQKP